VHSGASPSALLSSVSISDLSAPRRTPLLTLHRAPLLLIFLWHARFRVL